MSWKCIEPNLLMSEGTPGRLEPPPVNGPPDALPPGKQRPRAPRSTFKLLQTQHLRFRFPWRRRSAGASTVVALLRKERRGPLEPRHSAVHGTVDRRSSVQLPHDASPAPLDGSAPGRARPGRRTPPAPAAREPGAAGARRRMRRGGRGGVRRSAHVPAPLLPTTKARRRRGALSSTSKRRSPHPRRTPEPSSRAGASRGSFGTRRRWRFDCTDAEAKAA